MGVLMADDVAERVRRRDAVERRMETTILRADRFVRGEEDDAGEDNGGEST